MPKVHLTLKINVLKMEHVFDMGYCEGDKIFYVFLTNQQGEGKLVESHIHELNFHWRHVSVSFEEAFKSNVDLRRFFYYLQAWMPFISRIYPHDLLWHISIDSIMLDTRKGLVQLFVAMIDLNKYDFSQFLFEAQSYLDFLLSISFLSIKCLFILLCKFVKINHVKLSFIHDFFCIQSIGKIPLIQFKDVMSLDL